MSKRAERRAAYERRKKAEREKHPCCPTDRQIGIFANTRVRCSRECCRKSMPRRVLASNEGWL